MIYDVLMRLPLSVWALFYSASQVRALFQYVGPLNLVDAVHIAMRLSTITFMLLVAAVVILRTRPSGKASGLEPRITALAGSFMTYGVVFFPRRDLSLSLELVSTTLLLVGTAGAIAALYQLGRSFSIMTETRRLVTSGPYRFVRHPLYLTEQVAIIGLFIQFGSVWTAVFFAMQIACQLRRMYNEETLLTAAFPEYTGYQLTTARLIPGIY